MRYRITVLAFFLITTLCAQDIIFGVVPQQSPLILSKKWIPIMKELSERTGYNVVFKTEPSIPLFEEALYTGRYDIAYMNPYHYVIAHKKAGFEAIARAEKNIQGIIVAAKGTKLTDLNTSTGARFLFPAPMAFAATLLVKYELKKQFGIDADTVFETRYVNSHDSVYKGVARGIGSFGGGIVRTFKNLDDTDAKQKLEIIYRTKTYPSHPIAVSARHLPAEIRQTLEKAIRELSPPLLHELNIKNFVPTSDAEYVPVKALVSELGI